MIVGVGIDVVDIARFGRALERTPRLRTRLFGPDERGLALQSLAARFAAKEALSKALGVPVGLGWTEVTVVREGAGRPRFAVTGRSQQVVDDLGVAALHLSLSHDAGIASAVVVAEG